MDRNQATGLVMIALLFIVYFTFFAPDPEEMPATPAQTEEVEGAPTQQARPGQAGELPAQTFTSDSARQAALSQQYGVFAPGFSGESQEVVMENEELKITFDSKGGRIKSVLLKDFTTYEKEPLYLLNEETSQMSLLTSTPQGVIDLKQLYYQPSLSTRQLEGQEEAATELIFRLDLGQGRSIIQTYLLASEGFQLQHQVQTSGLDGLLTGQDVKFNWQNQMRNFEHDLEDSRSRSTVNYYTADEDYEELSRTGTVEEEEIAGSVKWAGMNHRFFTAAIIADDFFQGGEVAAIVPENSPNILKNAEIELSIAEEKLQNGLGMRFYFGPNNQRILTEIAPGFERNVELGYFFLRPINKWLIIPTFHFLENFFTNYGIIILLLVLFIKLLLFPLSYKSYISMAKTRVLKPQIDELKEKYGDDMTKMQQEQMKLYSQLGINPISGCVPMLLQMPILFSMFYFFPNSIELRQESFLWAEDLSSYDSILSLPFEIPFYGDHVSLFCLLMTASTILMTMTNQQMSTVQGPMKTISYIMPITFLFFLNSFPAGLTYYYFLSNIITFGQQGIIRRFVDDEKIKAIIEKNRIKNKDKKKSGFQARLEEALKASQEAKKSSEQTKKTRKK